MGTAPQTPTPPPTPQPGPSTPITAAPNTTPPQDPVQVQVELQESLEATTGLKIRGILGGLPVAEQSQEYFAVFNEAGDTGPEIIDKTQFRVTYLVDSSLNTSKPFEGSDAALNATQNFEKGKECIIRADNATVLNQNLTGKKTIYDIGSIALIATTETGSAPGAYTTTMSFSDLDGQDIVDPVDDLSCQFVANGDQTLDGNQGINALANYQNTVKAISGSDFLSFANDNTLTFVTNTTEGGTRVVVQGNIFAQGQFSGNNNSGIGVKVELEFDDGGLGNFVVVDTNEIIIPNDNLQYHYPDVYSGYYKNFVTGTKFRIRVTKTDGSDNILKIMGGNFRVRPEYLPGNQVIPGLNAVTASYWEPVYTNFNPPTGIGYSVLTASQQFSYFINSNFRSKLDPQSAIFDPKGDAVTFDPITTPLEMKRGDEIRFEYNKNKVHKVTDVNEFTNGTIAITVSPQISTGSVVDHFTYYRIQQDGGYLIADVEKNNDISSEQPFSGIVLPEFPSEQLRKRGDQLIFELKQAGIIEK